MTLRNVSQVFVSPLHEGEMIQNFTLNTQPQLPDTNHAYVLFVAVAEFQCDDTDVIVFFNLKEFMEMVGNSFCARCIPSLLF